MSEKLVEEAEAVSFRLYTEITDKRQADWYFNSVNFAVKNVEAIASSNTTLKAAAYLYTAVIGGLIELKDLRKKLHGVPGIDKVFKLIISLVGSSIITKETEENNVGSNSWFCYEFIPFKMKITTKVTWEVKLLLSLKKITHWLPIWWEVELEMSKEEAKSVCRSNHAFQAACQYLEMHLQKANSKKEKAYA